MKPAWILALAAATVVSGCADPYANSHRAPTAVAGEQPGPKAPVVPRPLRALPRNPEAAARRAVLLTGSWTAATVASNQRRLASISVGQARRDALQAAVRLPTDPQLRDGGTSSRATIKAISLHSTGASRSGLVVTHERLSTQGVVEERWRVTLITVARIGRGWAVSRLEPQE